MKEGRYVTGETEKDEKNDDQTKQSLQKKKKRYIKWEQQREKHSRMRTEKMFKKQMRINQKKGNFETKTNMQRQINMKQVPNKKGKGNRQTIFHICNSSTNLSFREVMDREDKRKRETNVKETRKHDEKKRDNR